MNKSYRDILDAAASLHVPDDLNLFPRVEAQLSQRKTFIQTLRARPALIIILSILAMLLLTGVVYAIGRSLGYIPGVGFVEQNTPVRVLAEQTSIERDGITLTIKQTVADSAQTLVIYRVKGVSILQGATEQQCTEAPALLLENRVRLEATGGHLSNMGGENGVLNFDANFTFPPLPADVKLVTLLGPCQLPALTLRLIPAPPGLILPATEIAPTFNSSRPVLPTLTASSPTETLAPESFPTNFPVTPTPVPNGSGLYLEKVVELENSYLLVGNFTDAGDLPGLLWSGAAQESVPYEFRVADHNGKAISFSFRPDLMPPSSWSNVTYWALEIRKPLDVPVTITLPEIAITNDDTFQFPLDVGAHPAVGQTWQLNQTIQVDGYSFLVKDIVATERGYTLNFHSLTSILPEDFSSNLNIEEKKASLLYERLHERDGVLELSQTLVFDDRPSGVITFTLHMMVENQVGPWTLTWLPPVKQ